MERKTAYLTLVIAAGMKLNDKTGAAKESAERDHSLLGPVN